MKVKYLQSMVGDRFVRSVGDEADVDDAEARRLIKAGFAAAVKAKDDEKKPDDKGFNSATVVTTVDGALIPNMLHHNNPFPPLREATLTRTSRSGSTFDLRSYMAIIVALGKRERNTTPPRTGTRVVKDRYVRHTAFSDLHHLTPRGAIR